MEKNDMFDIVATAKELIAKGQKLNDNELIKMGYELLSKNDPESNQPSEKIYRCTECGNTMDYDKPNRKKCLKCKKKHTGN